jgi:O-antigen/teichoic acid export membrane protein
VTNLNSSEEHLDPTAEITLEAVKERAVRGVAILTGRKFLLTALSLVATGFLTVLLDPAEIGIFWIVSSVKNFLAYFSDIGLAAALIQKKGKITNEELNTTFLVQQSLVIIILVILFVASPYLQSYYSLSREGLFLLYALGITLLFSSLKTIPSALLERELSFGRFVIPQVTENVIYNVSAVYFAWRGFGVTTFTYAVLLQGFSGLVAIYLIKPWFPGFKFSKKGLKDLLTFGVPYQASTFLATIKDDGMTAFLGGILGSSGIGFLGWAQKWAYTPLRLFMDDVLKVTFPAFSRMQKEKDHLKRSVTRSIFFVSFLVFPSVVGLLILAPLLIQIIPRYEKWTPALIPLALISINTIFAAATTQLTNLLNAIGKIKTTFKLMVMWTVLTWLFVPYLAIKYSVNGAAAGYALVGASSVIAILIVHRIVKFSLYNSVFAPAIGALGMGIILIVLRNYLSTNLTAVWVLGGAGFVCYMTMMYFLVGSSIFTDAKRGFKLMLNRG